MSSVTKVLILFLLITAAFGGARAARAQMPHVVALTESIQPPSVKPGGSGLLIVDFTLKPGYHIYPSKTTDPDLIPTVFKPTGLAGVTFAAVRFSRTQMVKLPSEPHPMAVYEGKGSIVTPFTVSKAAHAGSRTVTASFSYQACNATSCFPPASDTLSAHLSIK